MGMHIKEYGMLRGMTLKRSVVGALIALFLSVLEGIYVLRQFADMASAITQVKFSLGLYVIFVIAIIMNLSKKYNPSKHNILVYIGDESYGIYLCHLLVMKLVSNIISNIGYTFILTVYQFIQFVLVVLGSCFVTFIWNKIDKNGIRRWIRLGNSKNISDLTK